MEEMFEKYPKHLPAVLVEKKPSKDTGLLVVLTGSTGSLGSYILEVLMDLSCIEEIICFNRSMKEEEKQYEVRSKRGLSTNWKEKGVRFLHADLSKINLGLPEEEYQYLLSHATNIIRMYTINLADLDIH